MFCVWRVIKKMNSVKKKTLSILEYNGKISVNNIEKTELLVEILVKVHSSENLSEIVKDYKKKTLA